MRLYILAIALALSPLFSLASENLDTSCDIEKLRADYEGRDTHISTAAKYAIYGLLSNNSYSETSKKLRFWLPDYWDRVYTPPDTAVGLSLDVYEKKQDGVITEVVIAFRGTDEAKDRRNGWFSNNQYRVARKFIEQVLNNEKYQGVPVIATGHSLGGGLAMFASYQYPNVTAVGFNSSPRYNSAFHKEKNTRIILFEKGDGVRGVGNIWFPWRWGWMAKKMDIYFQKYDFSKKDNHAIYPLAKGLLLLGSLQNPELAEIAKHECGMSFDS